MSSQISSNIIWLASYPKSGNTWVRFILANLLWGKPETTAEVEQAIPDLHCCLANKNGITLDALLSQDNLVVKTHFQFPVFKAKALEKVRAATTGCIYVLRNPLDVIASNLNYRLLQGYSNLSSQEIEPFSNHYINDFIAKKGDQSWSKFGFGSWEENVNSWCLQQHNFPTLVIRYEDLIENTAFEVRKICDFLGLDANERELETAIANSSFLELKKLEDKVIANQETGMFYNSSYADAHQAGLRFINQGRIGEGKRKLSAQQRYKAAIAFAPLMEKFGYGE